MIKKQVELPKVAKGVSANYWKITELMVNRDTKLFIVKVEGYEDNVDRVKEIIERVTENDGSESLKPKTVVVPFTKYPIHTFSYAIDLEEGMIVEDKGFFEHCYNKLMYDENCILFGGVTYP